ncbi:MAG: putative selenocysteine system protein [Candidatus Thorarchaeota archaeon]
MEESKFESKITRTIPYVVESAVVFRIAWYSIASAPRVYLKEYSEAESKEFEAKAQFQAESDETHFIVKVLVKESSSNIELEILGENDKVVTDYMDTLSSSLETRLGKYVVLGTDVTGKLRRALVAKTCWDRIVYLIFQKRPLSEIYFQLAHGREMIIKATEGDDMAPITLSTSGWLSRTENLSKDEHLPSDIATSLAMKAVEWKKETHAVIARYI